MKTIAITTGDTDGIGLEVTAKALHRLGPSKGRLFFLFRNPSAKKKYLSLIDKKFKRLVVNNLSDALILLQKDSSALKSSSIIDICSTDTPPEWVQTAARACHRGILSGLVTAPLSKELIASLGWKDQGHTEILKRITKAPFIHQGYLGKHFNVVLATSHIPIKKISKIINHQTFSSALEAAKELQMFLSAPGRRKPIAVLGLNPHAGEKGILGTEEVRFLTPFCHRNKLEGPLSPDAAFFKKNWSRYSLYIACYHDQGLIPFKLIHGQDSGVQVSLGLPFPRTSVDHGTAKDIFGRDQANANSMFEAIKLILRMIKK